MQKRWPCQPCLTSSLPLRGGKQAPSMRSESGQTSSLLLSLCKYDENQAIKQLFSRPLHNESFPPRGQNTATLCNEKQDLATHSSKKFFCGCGICGSYEDKYTKLPNASKNRRNLERSFSNRFLKLPSGNLDTLAKILSMRQRWTEEDRISDFNEDCWQ